MLKKILSNSAGDTIVEVLISMAILSLVLAGAFYTANESLRNDRDSLEHSQALTIAEAQIEILRSDLANGVTDSCLSSTCYVINGNNTIQTSQPPATGPYYYTITTSENTINLAVSGIASGVNFNNYEIEVSWIASGGQGTDYVQLYYRDDS